MKWDDVAVFVAVAETGGFSRAGERLGLPKSTVSRHVARLEEALGAPLLHRTTRRVAPTPTGRALLERVGPMVAGLNRALEAPDLGSEPSGVLRVTAPPDLGAALLPEVVARYVALYPTVRVEALLTFDLLDLVEQPVDLAIRVHAEGLPDSPHLTAQRLGAISLGWYASPAYLARAGTPRTVAELDHHDTLGFHARRLSPDPPRVASDDVGFTRAACRAGAGIAELPTYLVEEDVRSGLLVRVVPDQARWTGSVWLLSPHDRHPPPRVTTFRDLLFATLQRTPIL